MAGDSRKKLDTEVEDSIYFALDQNPPLVQMFLIRTSADPASIANMLRDAVHKIDPDQPLDNLRTLEQVRSDSLSSPRLTTTLLSLFAGLALVITATGIGGVIGFFVNQRRHEIGIRMALGAERSAVLWMVLREGMILIIVGLSLGVAGALGLGHLMGGLLFGIQPTDPATFVLVALVLVGIAAGECFVPAHRAASIDPTVALRSD